jgi:Mn-dependent DtxR family transcriptional regulator
MPYKVRETLAKLQRAGLIIKRQSGSRLRRRWASAGRIVCRLQRLRERGSEVDSP